MTELTATLHVRARLRGGTVDAPVMVGHDTGHVVLIADPAHAEVLARMIARVTGELRDVDDVDPQLWDHVIVDLLAEKAIVAFEDQQLARTSDPRLVVVQ